MREWFRKNKIKSSDEIVIHFIDKKNFTYRLIPEKRFVLKTRELQNGFENSNNEQEASKRIVKLANWIQLDEQKIVLNEFKRLTDIVPIKKREYFRSSLTKTREKVPVSLRTLLESIYKGHCQVCDFWFLKKDNTLYFETHHLNPLYNHHTKNIIVVCGNCHNQFEYANVQNSYNKEGWLNNVSFNDRKYSVNQIAIKKIFKDSFKELFI